MDSPSIITQPAASELPSELPGDGPRAAFQQAYGTRVILALAVAGTLFLLPFSIHNYAHGRWALGVATSLLALCLLTNAAALAAGRTPPFPRVFLFGPALAALAIAMYDQGLIGILWAYAAILLFHFVLPRHLANWFNGSIVLMSIPTAWVHLGPEATPRVAITLLLTVVFTNIFSYLSDAQRRREQEQRQRLDLLVRGTNAGTLEWGAGGALQYSKRLKQMLGWPPEAAGRPEGFFELVHPDDRQRVREQVRSVFGREAQAHQLRHVPPADFRLMHATGETVWVHCEGIAVTDARGRTDRYICSFMDITEHVRAQETLLSAHEKMREQARRLEQQNIALREAIRLREEVERIARHDLKTPLASIASVPRLLREVRPPGPREDELLVMIERAARRVLSMVNLSLDLYRMEEGTYRLRPQPVDLAVLLRTVAAELQGHADSKQLTLAMDLPRGLPPARAEELLCYAILANLLKNALEASPDRETVRVSLSLEREDGQPRLVLAIHNAGAVPQPVRARFFQKYATHGKAGGSGLGAYSARLMATVQQGDLAMVTDEERGTTLTLRLPASAQVPAAQPDRPGRGRARKGVAAAPQAPQVPALAVLLVDDDAYNITVLRSLLPSGLASVDTAVNGRAALNSVDRARPDVIFLDLQMPVMGGMEAIGAIRRLQRARGQLPSTIVAFSARDDEATRHECSEAGFDQFLVKPATREELLSVLEGRQPNQAAPRTTVRPPDDVLALLPEFIASRRRWLRRLVRYADQGRREDLRKTAHMLAGSLAMYGFEVAGGLSREIELGAGARELPWLRQRARELVAQFELDQQQLRQAEEEA